MKTLSIISDAVIERKGAVLRLARGPSDGGGGTGPFELRFRRVAYVLLAEVVGGQEMDFANNANRPGHRCVGGTSLLDIYMYI